MSVAPFFDRVVTAVGRHLTIERAALEERLAGVAPGIECSDPETAARWTDELLANMLARLYPRLVVVGNGQVADSCRAIARAINPSIELSDDLGAATLVISTSAMQTTTKTLAAGSRGWSAFLAGDAPPQTGASHNNVFAAAAAAALAARECFRRLVLNAEPEARPLRCNLLTFREDDSDTIVDHERLSVDLGHVLIAGVGAVGNAALWCLRRHAGLSGNAWLIDPEPIELSNLQRYVLADYSDVGVAKTLLAERVLEGSGLRVCRLDGRLGDAPIPEAIERVLVSVDNIEGRRIAQSLLPRLVVNGWTSETGLGASWHDFARGRGCLCCVYQPSGPVQSEIEVIASALGLPPGRAAHLVMTAGPIAAHDIEAVARHLVRSVAELGHWVGRPLRECYVSLICGGGAVPVGTDTARAVVPLVHQSVLAGVLAAAELVKRTTPGLAHAPAHNHVAWDDLARPMPAKWTRMVGHAPGCICRDRDYRAVYREKWGDA